MSFTAENEKDVFENCVALLSVTASTKSLLTRVASKGIQHVARSGISFMMTFFHFL